jgi:hypothetical protein
MLQGGLQFDLHATIVQFLFNCSLLHHVSPSSPSASPHYHPHPPAPLHSTRHPHRRRQRSSPHLTTASASTKADFVPEDLKVRLCWPLPLRTHRTCPFRDRVPPRGASHCWHHPGSPDRQDYPDCAQIEDRSRRLLARANITISTIIMNRSRAGDIPHHS